MSSTSFDNNINLSSSALDAHLSNLRNRIPPSLQAVCFPDSTSSLVRNIILAMVALNILLFLASLSTISARYLGMAMLLTSIVSCCHVASVAILLGSHVAGPDNRGSGGIMGGNNLGMGALATQLTNFLRHTSQRHGSNSFVYGALFGATVLMTLVMHILSVYFGHLVACVKFNVSANDSTASNVVKHTGFHLFSQCGASGAVGFVSFLTGLLVWLNFSLAIVLYAGREALMSDAHSHQYDEIGSDNINRNGGFDGDFPLNGVSGMRTMQV